MSQIIFNSYIDLQNIAATPSGIGYTVGYDLDGILKQKDQDGNITPVGQTTTQNLSQTLQQGGDSETYSIMMGTATSILSGNGTGEIRLDYGSTSSVFISATLSDSTAYAHISNNVSSVGNSKGSNLSKISFTYATFSTYAGSSTFSTSITQDGNTLTIAHDDTVIGAGGRINIFETGKTYNGIGSENMAYVHINTKDSLTNNGVKNSVIIGGAGLTASTSETVYLGNSVNINNAYTLPSEDGLNGQFLKTNGGGTVSWSDTISQASSLSEVLAQGNSTDIQSIVMGTGSYIVSQNGGGIILLDYSGLTNSILISTDGGANLESYIRMSTASISLSAKDGFVTTGSLNGLVYTADYSSTFVTNSLVTKKYVDNLSSSFNTYRVAYVDSAYGDNSAGILGRVDRPYLTIASASNALYSSYASGMVYIKKGQYTEIVKLKNNVNYFCESDVVFTENGFTDVDGAVSSNIYGMASFLGTNTNLVPLNIQNASIVNFEFDRIDNKQVGLKASAGTINFSGNYLKTLCEFGSGISVQDGASVNINIREKIVGAYEVVYAKSGFSGSLSISTPVIEVNGDLGSSGVQSGLVHALRVHQSTTGIVNIKSDLINTSSTFGGGDNSAVSVASGTVSIVGKVDGRVSNGVYIPSGGSGNLSVAGNISSFIESIVNISSGVSVKVSNSLISSEGLGAFTQSIYINSSDAKLYVINSTVYNSLSDSSLVNIATASAVAFYNTLAYSAGTTGNFIYATSSVAVGMHNVRSNKDNSASVSDQFSPSGFIYDPNFYIPNY